MQKIMLFCCTVIVLLLQSLSVNAQREFKPDPILYQKIQDSVYANAPYVFEAEHLEYKNVALNGWNEKVELVRVRQSYRGDLKVGDTIEVWFHDQRRNDGKGLKVIRNQHFIPNHNYIESNGGAWKIFFFCKKTDNAKVFANTTKTLRYMTEVPVSRIVEYDYDFSVGFVGLSEPSKTTEIEAKLTSITDKVDAHQIKKPKTKSQKRKRPFGDAKSILPPVGLEVYAANHTVGGGYYEFDVMAQAQSATYPNNISFVMAYNPAYFCGTCAGTTDFVTATLDVAFQGTILAGGQQRTKYTIPTPYWEVLQQKVGINLKLNDYTQYGAVNYARPLLSTTPQKLMRIKLKLINPSITCVPNAGTFNLGLNSYFTTTTNAVFSAINPYTITFPNSAVFRTNNSIPCAAPVITSFSPQALRAGAGDTLTIIGTDFGAYGTKSAVQFRSAENPYVNGLDNYILDMAGIDTIMWSNTMIKIRVPSYYYDVSDTTFKKPASGKIRVRRHSDQAQSTPSANILHIKSNFFQSDVPNRPYWSGKGYYRLTNRNCRKNYVIRCHKLVSSEKRAHIYAAAKEWNRRLGYNIFEIDVTTTTNIGFTGDTCIISQDSIPDANIGNYIVATQPYVTNTRLKIHPDSLAIANRGFDMRIALNALDGSSNNFMYDSTGTATKKVNQTDFYGVMLHEFGHALGLEHALDPLNTTLAYKDAELMHFRINFADSLLPAQRKNLTSSGGESLQGVQNILQRSQNTQWDFGSSGFGTIGTTPTPINIVSEKVKLCNYQQGYVELTSVPNASYIWQWLPWGGNTWADVPLNHANFIGGRTNKLLINYNTGFNPNNYKIRCMVNHNGCDKIGGVTGTNSITATEKTILTGQSAVLKPIPTICRPSATTFALETSATPVNGAYKLYNSTGVEIVNAFNPNYSPTLNFTNVPVGRYES
jgi:hypothetical protein